MFNFKDAFLYIFKEKNWGAKFIIPLVLYLIVVLPSVLISFIEPESASTLNSLRATRVSTTSDTLALVISCVVLIGIIPYLVVNFWYMYENTQSGISMRETTAIWRNPLSDTLKKVTKYFLVSLVYGLIASIVALVLLGIACGIFFVATAAAGSVFQNGVDINNFLVFLTSGLGLFLICFFGMIFIVLYAVFFIWSTFGSLRLIGTNTLSEGLKLEENWRIAWRHKWKFVLLFGLVLIFSTMLGMISGISGIFTELFTQNFPLIGFVAQLVLQIVIALITTYATIFVYPRLLGQLFRKIVSEEPALEHIKL